MRDLLFGIISKATGFRCFLKRKDAEAVESIDIEALEVFAAGDVSVAILGEQGEETPPSFKKTIKRMENCPDGTHLRIYFDDFYFFAVPLISEVVFSDEQWTAYDKESGLYYVIKRESESHE